MPQVSVVMSVYDQVESGFLARAVSSIQRQTFKDFDFTIVADGELSPRQQEILARSKESDSRVQLLRNERKMGLAYSMNRAIASSASKYIARMDADDVSLPERLERQIVFLEQHKDIDLVGTFAYEVDEADRIIFYKRLPTCSQELSRFLGKRDPFIHPTVVFRKSFFDRVGMYKPFLSVKLEDTELWCRAFVKGMRGGNIPEFLYMFRVDRGLLKRRRGYRYALQEAKLRWNYIRHSALPLYYNAYPLLTFSMRMAPECILRGLYKVAR